MQRKITLYLLLPILIFISCRNNRRSRLQPPRHGGVYVVAHRGAHNGIPENTLPAYQKAIELGADFVEIDVRTTKDRRFVSVHNSTIDGYVEGASGKIEDFTLEELKQFDVGARIGPEWAGTRIPTFDEILDLCKGKIGIYLDLKNAPVEPLIEKIKARGMERQVLWYAGLNELKRVKQLCPEGLIMPDPGEEENIPRLVSELHPKVIAAVWRHYSKTFVESVHNAGAIVIVDESTPECWQQALDWGTDGIQTDYPAELIRYLSQHPQNKVDWLRSEARRQLKGSQIVASDGTVLYTPDGEGNYAALWTRDFAYMVENAFDLIPVEHIRSAILYLLNAQRQDGFIPDRVRADGQAVYSAGPVDKPLGDPPTDNSQFMVSLVYSYVTHTSDYEFFEDHAQQLVKAMEVVPRSDRGLVFIDPANPHSPYGFTDTIQKTGELLFSSLLYWQASRQLAALFERLHESESEKFFRLQAKLIEKNIDVLWDAENGMFSAATIDCRQIDIWGNAFAVYIGFPLGEKKDSITAYLSRNFDRFVLNGQIRHLPLPEFWEKTLTPVAPGTYQNGGYWGTASGWVAYALKDAYPGKAKRILNEVIQDYQKYGTHEWISPGKRQLRNYVASVVNLLAATTKE